ncbi:MAG: glycosyltransferase, partial [Nanoarchaeota archaeon]|nr:glycosyltransferase [Nanoarchaeota archaeon]
MPKPIISVIVPAFNDSVRLEKCLKSIKEQDYKKPYEIIVVDDRSTDNTRAVAQKYAEVFSNSINSGPAKARNLGVKKSKADIIAFTDSDCIVSKNWLSMIEKTMKDRKIDAVMGKVSIPKAGYIGDSISALGFPAGGSLGYDKMYHVKKDRTTNHFSTCNCAIRREIFDRFGFFDETYPTPGREDTEFSWRIWKGNAKIIYSDKIRITHEARTSIKSLIKMNYARGRGTYHFKKKMPKEVVTYFKKLRVWSAKNM